MQEIEDPGIKLFGKKIPLAAAAAAICEVKWMEDEEAGDSDDGTEQGVAVDAHSQSEVPSSAEEEGAGESAAPKLMKESSENCNSWGKTLKKPDKILPCLRCDSMDT